MVLVPERYAWSNQYTKLNLRLLAFKPWSNQLNPCSGREELNSNLKHQRPRYLPLDYQYYSNKVYRIYYYGLKAVKGSMVAGNDYESEFPELDWMRLGVVGRACLQLAPKHIRHKARHVACLDDWLLSCVPYLSCEWSPLHGGGST